MSQPMDPGDARDAQDLARFGYKQELSRSLGGFSCFAAGFSYISILTGMFQTADTWASCSPARAFIWAWPFVFAGQMMVALQFAELAAHYPIAGSVYQWSKKMSPRAWAWNNGWIYLCAQLVTIPAVARRLAGDPAADLGRLPDHQVLARSGPTPVRTRTSRPTWTRRSRRTACCSARS